MSQAAKNKVTTALEGSEEVLAKCNMTGQKGRRVKLDATHLLNFTTDSHKYHGQHGAPSSAYNRARRSTAYTRGYTKEHYLLSNARFVVQQGLDCEGYLFNPDQMFPWEVILQIHLITTSLPSCPICLSRPEAARVTKCGHTYCLPCIMHFFSSAEGKWEPCPVCGEIIKLADSKPVVILQKREFKAGDMVNFVKVCRPVDLNYPLPCYLDRGKSRDLLTCSDKGGQFAKILTADNQFKKQALIRDRNELYRVLKDNLCDVTFVHKALEVIDSQLTDYDAIEITDSATNVFADEFVDETVYPDERFAEIDTEMSYKYNQEDWVFTYQSADGQYIFLDPLNTAMLREEYGMLSKSPDRIRVQILNITHHVVSEQLRSRFKWLSHLPLMCELQFFEVCLKPPLVSRCVLENFRDTVEKRRINRQIKQKKEEVSDKKAAAYWNKTYPSLLVSDSVEQLPDFSMESFTPLPSTLTSIVTEPSQLSSSFAQALSHQYTPSKQIDITSKPVENTPIDHSSESDDEFAPPTNRESLSNVIATKLDAYLLQKDLEGVPKSKVQSGPTRSKRGKGKKIVLFSTSAGRPS